MCIVSDGLAIFFFQAEDGIRDLTVTGVQTCALPISTYHESEHEPRDRPAHSSTLQSEHDGAVTLHAPRADVIEVIRGAETTGVAQLLEGRLYVAGLVDRTAPERCFPAIPLPQVPEPRVALGEHRLLQLGGLPLFPPVGADVHPGNPAPTAPRDSADLPPAPVVKDHRVCMKRDDRLRVHDEEIGRAHV